MELLIFWLCIIICLLCSSGLTAAWLLHKLVPIVFWMKEFIRIMIGSIFIMIAQALYISFSSTSEDFLLNNLYFTFVHLSGFIIITGYLPIFWSYKETINIVIVKIILSLLGLITAISILLQWISIENLLSRFIVFILAMVIISSSLSVIINRNIIKKRENGKFLIIFCVLSICSYFFEFLEYFLRFSNQSLLQNLPVGFISFPGFCTILAITAAVFSIKMVKALQHQVRGGVPTEDQIEEFNIKHKLTNREKEIVKLLLLRFSHKEIADKLYISPRTVERHVYNVYQKSGLSSRFELYDEIQKQG